eukprot:IDg11685t1
MLFASQHGHLSPAEHAKRTHKNYSWDFAIQPQKAAPTTHCYSGPSGKTNYSADDVTNLIYVVHDFLALGANIWAIIEHSCNNWATDVDRSPRDVESLELKFDNLAAAACLSDGNDANSSDSSELTPTLVDPIDKTYDSTQFSEPTSKSTFENSQSGGSGRSGRKKRQIMATDRQRIARPKELSERKEVAIIVTTPAEAELLALRLGSA